MLSHKRAESNQSFNGRVQRHVCLREQSTVSRHGGAKTGALRLSGTLDDLANERMYVRRRHNEEDGNRCADGGGGQVTGICGNTLGAATRQVVGWGGGCLMMATMDGKLETDGPM